MTKPTDAALGATRLPQYYRILRRFLQAGIYRCSSAEIAAHTAYSAVAVRKDLARFGGCAKQGYGYHVKQLYTALGEYLGLQDQFRAVAVGAAAPLSLVTEHPLFAVHGIRLCGAICTEQNAAAKDPALTLSDLPSLCRTAHASLLVLLSPVEESLLHAAVDAGVRGILSLCDEDDAVRAVAQARGIAVRRLHPMDDLISLCCEMRLAAQNQTKENKI